MILKPGTELHLRIGTSLAKASELLRLRIARAGTGVELGLYSGVPTIEGRVIGSFFAELDLWAAVAIFAAEWDGAPLPASPSFELAMVLVVVGAGSKVLTSLRFASERELWAGLADYAAGRQADIAMVAMQQEERERYRGSGSR